MKILGDWHFVGLGLFLLSTYVRITKTPDGTDGLEGEPTDDGALRLSQHPQWDVSLSG